MSGVHSLNSTLPILLEQCKDTSEITWWILVVKNDCIWQWFDPAATALRWSNERPKHPHHRIHSSLGLSHRQPIHLCFQKPAIPASLYQGESITTKTQPRFHADLVVTKSPSQLSNLHMPSKDWLMWDWLTFRIYVRNTCVVYFCLPHGRPRFTYSFLGTFYFCASSFWILHIFNTYFHFQLSNLLVSWLELYLFLRA